MKITLKLVAVMMVAALALSFTACSGGTGANSNSSTTSTTSKANYKLVSAGKLIMGTNAEFPPFEYKEGGNVVGFDASMMKKVAEKLGLTLEIKDMAFDSLPQALSAGQIDVIAAGYTVKPEREAQMSFADSYYTASQTIIVKKDSTIAKKEDLKGKKVGVQAGTTGQFEVEDIQGDANKSLVKQYGNGSLAVEALKNGQVDAVVIDNNPAKQYFNQNSDTLKLIEKQFADEDYAVAMKKDNTELLTAINNAIKELKDDGSLNSIKNQFIK